MMRFLFLPFAWLMCFASCSAIKPEPPALPLSRLNSTPLPESKIDVPVTIDMSQVFNDLGSKIPLVFSGQGSAGPAQYRWSMKRTPFNLSLSGNSILIIDSAHFTSGGYLKNPFNGQWKNICSCDADAVIGLNTVFQVSKNYTLSGNAAITRFDLKTCDLNVVNFDLAPLVKQNTLAKLKELIEDFNRQHQQYSFKPLLQPAWTELNQPVKIADIGYLVLNPSAVRLGQLSGKGHFLNLSAGITARPVFYLSDPGKINNSPLPNISTDAQDNGFNVNMDIHLDYQPLNEILKNSVAEQRIENGTKGYVIIKGAEVYGTGNNHLLIKVKFSGKEGAFPYHGIIYFTCLPLYDTATGNLFVSNIDFAVDTKRKLAEGPAAWILGSTLKTYIGSQVKLNILGQINAAKSRLNQAINQRINPNITLVGSVATLSLEGMLPNSDHLLIRCAASGQLAVKVN